MTHRPILRFFNSYEPVITIYRDLPPALADAGFAVELMVSKTLYRADKEPLEALEQQSPHIRIRRIWAPARIAESRFAKLATMACYIVGMVLTSLFGRGAAINLFLTQPPFSSVWGALLKSLRGQKFACLLMDIYPDVMIRDGLIREDSRIARLLSGWVRWSWRRADAIIVIGRCMRDYVVAAGVDPARVHVIPNWNDEKSVQPVARDANPLLIEHGLSDKFVVLYSGNLGVSHQFDDIMAAAVALRNRTEIAFVFIGSGSRLAEVKAAVADHALTNVRFLPYQPFNILHQSLGMADVHYVCLRDSFTGLVVPSKTYPALASGRPVIFSGSETCEIAQCIAEHQAGMVIRQGDSEALIAAIANYADDQERAARDGEAASVAANGPLSRQSCLADYAALFRALTGAAAG
jgi:glycosyltransferase involved in cell wall biosynthesis